MLGLVGSGTHGIVFAGAGVIGAGVVGAGVVGAGVVIFGQGPISCHWQLKYSPDIPHSFTDAFSQDLSSPQQIPVIGGGSGGWGLGVVGAGVVGITGFL